MNIIMCIAGHNAVSHWILQFPITHSATDWLQTSCDVNMAAVMVLN